MMELSDEAWKVVGRLTKGKIEWDTLRSLDDAERSEVLRVMVERGFIIPIEGDIVPEGSYRYTGTEEGYGVRILGSNQLELPVVGGRRYLFAEERFARAYAKSTCKAGDLVKIHKRKLP